MDRHLIDILKEAGFHEDCMTRLCQAEKCLADRSDWRHCMTLSPLDTALRPLSLKENHRDVACSTGLEEELLDLLHLILYLPQLEELYRQKEIERMFLIDMVRDLKAKAEECIAIQGYWGTAFFVWHVQFYRLERFALGRLVYESRSWPNDTFPYGEVCVQHGDRILGMHIPSGAPLTREACVDSLKKAFDFYGCSKENPLIVHCRSWLISPDHREMLSPESNLVRFMDMFYPVGVIEQETFDNAWRVFGRAVKEKPVAEWPTDTALQRGYIKWLLAGKQTHVGIGVLIFNGSELVTES